MLNGPLTHLISDLHLQPERPDTVRRFRDYLAGPARDAAALYILGDLFEYWVGDDCLDEPASFERDVCAALRRLADAGTRLFFIAGNRDFLAGPGFAAASGAKLLPEAVIADLAGTKTLLLHGDTLCTDDVKYQAFRRTIRSPGWQQVFLARPLPERLAEIEALRERSRREISEKPAAIMDANAEAVTQAFRHHNVSRMVHGHTHRQGHHVYEVDAKACERWVLGDWGDSGNYLVCAPDGWRFAVVGS